MYSLRPENVFAFYWNDNLEKLYIKEFLVFKIKFMMISWYVGNIRNYIEHSFTYCYICIEEYILREIFFISYIQDLN